MTSPSADTRQTTTPRPTTTPRDTTMLRHNQIDIALHQLRPARGHDRALLLLHALGESTGTDIPPPWDQWEGPVWGLDFTGHGDSTVPKGGGYTPEILASDVDIALAHIGRATIVGRGLGAYVAMLFAGARSDQIDGLVLADGAGLAGGGDEPSSGLWVDPMPVEGTPDPFALIELATDVRPADYIMGFLRILLDRSPLEVPVVVTAKAAPRWLVAVAREPGVITETPQEALFRYQG